MVAWLRALVAWVMPAGAGPAEAMMSATEKWLYCDRGLVVTASLASTPQAQQESRLAAAAT